MQAKYFFSGLSCALIVLLTAAQNTVFDAIMDGEVSATILYEDDLALAFEDIHPQAPVHFLVIPKVKDGLDMLSSMREDQSGLVGHLMYVAKTVAKQQGLRDGYRLVVNSGNDGGQTVPHLHLHVMGGRVMYWPPG